jgi:hypothetical protein
MLHARARPRGDVSACRIPQVTDIINARANLRTALDLLIKAACGLDGLPRPEGQNQRDSEGPREPS